MHKLKFAIIGCGYISTNHIRAIIDNFKDAELISVCDLLKNRAELKADEYVKKAKENHLTVKRPTVFNDYREMLKKENIDTCAICTISGYRTKISLYCMELKKNVLVEKPMAMSTMDANRMIKAAEKNKVKLAVCYQNRFRPTIQKLRQAIDEESFGRIIAGTARILWNRNRDYYERAKWRGTWKLDGGCLMNQCSHNIDLLQWLMSSEIDTVFGQIGNYLHPYNETEDYGSIIIRFKNGAIGNVEGTTCIYPQNLGETLTILGEKGTVVIGGIALDKVMIWNFEYKRKSIEEVQKECDLKSENIHSKGRHTPLYKNFIDSIQNNTNPLIDGYEGKKSLSIVLMAYQSQKYSKPIAYSENLSISSEDFMGMLR
jgi:predicted dehydrogenase